MFLIEFRYRTKTNYSSHGSETGQRLTIVLKGAQGQELLILFMGIRGNTHSSQDAGDAFAKCIAPNTPIVFLLPCTKTKDDGILFFYMIPVQNFPPTLPSIDTSK